MRNTTKQKVVFLLASLSLILVVTVISSSWIFKKESEGLLRRIYQASHEAKLLSTDTRARNMRELYDSVRAYVIFIGHQRSGHSLVGSLLDAHPEVVITHEQATKWSLFHQDAENEPEWSARKRLFYYKIHQTSLSQATFGLRADIPPREDTNHSYNYHVHGQWQGQYRDKITVMGDKSGKITAEYFRNPDNMVKLEYIQRNLGVSLKIIHVLRNPFDVLATRVLRIENARDIASAERKVENTERLHGFITEYFERTETIARIRQEYNVLDILGHELVQRPKESMQKVCHYIGITCEEDYIDACAKLLFGEPAITRTLIEWTDDEKRWVQQEIDKYPFLKRYYSFHSDY